MARPAPPGQAAPEAISQRPATPGPRLPPPEAPAATLIDVQAVEPAPQRLQRLTPAPAQRPERSPAPARVAPPPLTQRTPRAEAQPTPPAEEPQAPLPAPPSLDAIRSAPPMAEAPAQTRTEAIPEPVQQPSFTPPRLDPPIHKAPPVVEISQPRMPTFSQPEISADVIEPSPQTPLQPPPLPALRPPTARPLAPEQKTPVDEISLAEHTPERRTQPESDTPASTPEPEEADLVPFEWAPDAPPGLGSRMQVNGRWIPRASSARWSRRLATRYQQRALRRIR